MGDLDQQLQQILAQLRQDGQLRKIYPLSHRAQSRVTVSGRSYLNLSGNDYLGLAANRDLVEHFYSELGSDTILEKYGPGAAASRLMTGNSQLYDALESKLALMYGTERALVFNSGYHGNAGILPALASKKDLILADKLCHASLIDGMRLSRAETIRYNHLDYNQAAGILERKRHHYNQVYLVSESIFSMDGDRADLKKLIDLKEKYRCTLYVDEAHALGVFGSRGLGLAEQEDVMDRIDLLFGTFGKALGGVGGFVVCSETIADYLVNTARTLIYTTGLPPVCLKWLIFVLDRIALMQDERNSLQVLAETTRQNLAGQGLRTGGDSQIIPVIIGDSAKTVYVADRLRDQGFWVTAVRPPTVPIGTARLRLSLSSAMTLDDLDPLSALIAAALE